MSAGPRLGLPQVEWLAVSGRGGWLLVAVVVGCPLGSVGWLPQGGRLAVIGLGEWWLVCAGMWQAVDWGGHRPGSVVAAGSAARGEWPR